MSYPPDLNDAWAKLRWAEQHFRPLAKDIRTFEDANPHRIRFEAHPESGEYVFYVEDLAAVPDDWGLRIGDCAHNARTALDYLAVALVAMCTREDPAEIDYVQFPIYSVPGKFNDWRSALWQKAQKRGVGEPLLAGYLTRLTELQPYNAMDPSIWGADVLQRASASLYLGRLSDLDNLDKHRLIHPVWLQAAFFKGERLIPPPGFQSTGSGTSGEPLEDSAEIGRVYFPPDKFPADWRPNEMEMHRAFPVEVALADPSPVKGVVSKLAGCLWAVRATLEVFAPVFAGDLRPLPLTAITLPA